MAPVGVWSLANPDLVERLQEGFPLNEADRKHCTLVTETRVTQIVEKINEKRRR